MKRTSTTVSRALLAGLAAILFAGQACAANTRYFFHLVDDTGTPIAGASFSQTALKDVGTGTTISFSIATPVDLGDGDYSVLYDPEANGEALLKLTPTKAGSTFTSDNALVRVYMIKDSGRLLTALPNAAPAASGGIPSVGTGSGQLNPDGSGNVPMAMGQTIPTTPTSGTVGDALQNAQFLAGRTNTAQTGTSTTITLDSGASSVDNTYAQGFLIRLISGTGSGQARTIEGYVGSTKVATVDHAWATTPDNTSVFKIYPWPVANVGMVGNQVATASVPVVFPGSIGTSTYAGGAVASVTGAVGSVTGSVGSVTGSVGSVTGAVGSVTGSVGSVTANVNTNANATETAIKAKTDLIATNAMDSPNAVTAQTEIAAVPSAASLWNTLTSGMTTAGSIGNLLATDINATVGSRSTYAGADTSGTTTLLTRIPGTVQPQTGDSFAHLTGTTDPAIASVQTSVNALPTASAITTAMMSYVIDGSISFRQLQTIMLAEWIGARVDGGINSGTHTQLFVYKNQAAATLVSSTVHYNNSGSVTTSRDAAVLTNLPTP